MNAGTLRSAGFKSTDTVSHVVQRTGLDAGEVRRQAGLGGAATHLDDAALDRRFAFPDGFQAGASTSSADVSSTARQGTGAPAHNSGAGGLLRLQLDAQLKKAAPARAAPFPDAAAYKERGAHTAATKAVLLERIGTLDEARALTQRLGENGRVSGDDLQAYVFDLVSGLHRSLGAEGIPAALEAAFATPLPPFVDAPVHVDVAALPLDGKAFPFLGAHIGALGKALVAAGVDRPELVDELGRRMDLSRLVIENAPDTALFHLLHDASNSLGAEPTMAALRAALATPLSARAQEPLRFDLASLPADTAKFPFAGALMGALARVIVDGGVDTMPRARAFADRLGIGRDVGGSPAGSFMAGAMMELQRACADDMPAMLKSVRDALAAPLDGKSNGGLPPSVDVSAVQAARDPRALVEALLDVVDTPAKCMELAYRMELAADVVGPDQVSPRQFMHGLIDEAERRGMDIVAALKGP